MTEHRLSNEFLVSTNELFNGALKITARPNELLLRLLGLNECGCQNEASFNSLIASEMLMRLGRGIVGAAGLHLLATTNHDKMDQEAETETATVDNILQRCEDLNAIYEK